MIIRLAPRGPELLVEDGILRASEVGSVVATASLLAEARQLAEETVADAGKRASEMLETAQAEANAVRSQAEELAATLEENAEARGYEAGEHRAAESWHERHAQLIEAEAEARQETQNQLAEVVTQAVLRVIDEQPREVIFMRAFKTVHSLLPTCTEMTLRVAPQDAAAAHAAIDTCLADAESGWIVDVQADASLPAGSSIFTSAIGTVDLSLPTQLDALRTALERAVRKAAATDTPDEEWQEDEDEDEDEM
ncbi:MAG TPA: FliH/SctL family protein [Burkholderiaceae bacterium]|nr:FliH/SctL family protein [Burkholderiaceae bacterium]